MVKESDAEEVTQSLVIKGVERIESIVTRDETRVAATLTTWQCSRLVRRDYYLMCYKMFLLSKKETAGQRIERRLRDLTMEGLAITALAAPTSVVDDVQTSTFTIRVVSPEARVLLNVLVAFDQALANLIAVHGTTAAMELCAGFFAAFGRLKQALFQAKPEKSKAEPVAPAVAAAHIPTQISGNFKFTKWTRFFDRIRRRILELLG